MNSLARTQVPRFEGGPDKWPYFWGLFSALVDQNPNLPSAIKFAHLNNALGGGVKDAISCLLLTDRYGDPRDVVDVQLRRIMAWRPVEERDREEFQRFADALQAAVFALNNQHMNTNCGVIHSARNWCVNCPLVRRTRGWGKWSNGLPPKTCGGLPGGRKTGQRRCDDVIATMTQRRRPPCNRHVARRPISQWRLPSQGSKYWWRQPSPVRCPDRRRVTVATQSQSVTLSWPQYDSALGASQVEGRVLVA